VRGCVGFRKRGEKEWVPAFKKVARRKECCLPCPGMGGSEMKRIRVQSRPRFISPTRLQGDPQIRASKTNHTSPQTTGPARRNRISSATGFITGARTDEIVCLPVVGSCAYGAERCATFIHIPAAFNHRPQLTTSPTPTPASSPASPHRALNVYVVSPSHRPQRTANQHWIRIPPPPGSISRAGTTGRRRCCCSRRRRSSGAVKGETELDRRQDQAEEEAGTGEPKFEPEAFRDALIAHLNSLPPNPTSDAIIAKLVLAGSQLELLKYAEQFYELIILGGLLQPGGSYLDNERSRFSVWACGKTEGLGWELNDNAEEGGETKGDWKKQVRELVEVLKKVIQRYKYLQKPLEENSLPGILQYLPKWDPEMREKLAYATAYFLSEGLSHGRCFQSLYKDHVVKDDVALNFITTFFKAYLSTQSMDHLAVTLRKAGVNDLLLVFPQPKRDRAHLEAHFKKEGLQPVVDWYTKKVITAARDQIVTRVKEMLQAEESSDDIVEWIKARQAESPVSEVDVVSFIWTALMENVDWSAKPDQIEGFVLKDIANNAPILEPFCSSAKAEVALINAVQVYCYTDTRIIKAFPQILKVLYNTDCISDQAIIYWAAKGAKPQGKQHFIKATEPLVKFLQEQEDESDDE